MFGQFQRPLFPWEEEALAEPVQVQDPNMMPGFSRININAIISAAKAKRLALGNDNRNVFLEHVKWPTMASFSVDAFIRTRELFNAAVKASFTSCLFKEFKECMTDTVRRECRRNFSNMSEEKWILLDDNKLQQWLAIFFGPKSKEDAIRRLSDVKFPVHEDISDSQSEFVNKLAICAYNFELIVNDIADTHTKWVKDPGQLSSGELTRKEVMEIWRRKFPRQEGRVFSVQMKEARDFMERQKDLLFNTIVLMISNHFTQIDRQVETGKTQYTTIPSKKRAPSAAEGQPRSPFGRTPPQSPASTFGGAVKRNRTPDQTAIRSPRGADTKFVKKVVPGHMRGVACGNLNNHFGLGCTATTCLFVGTSHDKNKNGHTWKDSDKEATVSIPKPDYDALQKSKPYVLVNWAKAKDARDKAKHVARVSAIESGVAIPSDSDDDADLAALQDEFGQDSDNSADVSDSGTDRVTPVNREHCVVSAIASRSPDDNTDKEMSTERLLKLNKMRQFFGIVRTIDKLDNVCLVKTLIDPGATYNIVSPKVQKDCAIQEIPVCLDLFQGHKRQGNVACMAQCRFELQNSHKEFVKHIEWCLCADLGYDLLLGRKFCHDNGFTRFEELLSEWNAEKETDKPQQSVVSALQSIASTPAQMVFIKFAREEAPIGKARSKRPDKALRCKLFENAATNRISSSALTASNPLSNIKVLNSKPTTTGKQIQLQFRVECSSAEASNTSFTDWFEVDDTMPAGTVSLAQSCTAMDVVMSSGKRRSLANSATSKIASANMGDHNQPDHVVSVDSSAELTAPDTEVSQPRHRHFPVCGEFVPLVTDANKGIMRFTRNQLRSRTAQTVVVDKLAAHNAIDASLFSDKTSRATIKQFQSKIRADIPFVLLEFSLECTDRRNSKVKLREWFRVVNNGSENAKIVIRGIFDEERLLAGTCRHSATRLDTDIHTAASPDANPPAEVVDVNSSWGGMSQEAKDQFIRNCKRQRADTRFISLHPVSHYRLKRDVNRPPLRPCDKEHVSYLGSNRLKNIESQFDIAQQINKLSIASSKRVLKHMVKLLPPELQDAETAAIAALSAAHLCNFEEIIDHNSNASCKAQIASLAAADERVEPASQKWTGDERFKMGMYVEIRDAKSTTDLNGKRVRLYEKADTPLVWIIRVNGKNAGLWKCQEKFLHPLSQLEQAKARPAGHEAGFLDVAIDEAGQPTGELPPIAHRQFGSEYSAQLTQKIEELKKQYPQVFTSDVSEPCGFEKMKIILVPNAILPSKSRFYRNTPLMKEEVRRQIQEQLDWGAIKKAPTPHCSDILLVKRPHMPGKWRFVINFQRLNDATVPEQLIMPDPASQHARLSGCSIFGAFDLSSYFRQLQLDEDSQYLTGFASDEGTYIHTRVPMGIRNAPAFAQRVLQDALLQDPVLGQIGIKNYFDDVPFGAKSEEEFLFVMEAMLKFFAKWKLKVNPEKSIFGVTSITHVGFIVSKDGIAIDPERTKDISELQPPKSIKKVQSVLGVMNYVRNFIPDFSAKAKHLTDKLSAAPSTHAKSATAQKAAAPPFVWTTSDQKQFDELKACVIAAPLLSQLDYSKQIFIRCDASRFGAGAVLFQYDDQGREFVACYASRKFLPAETRWSTFQQEASTVVWALERFREFTQGYHVIVECDHRNISFVKRSSMPQLARWRMRLQDHDFSIQFLSGCLNSAADGLSRSCVDDVDVTHADVMPECSLLYAKPSATSTYADVAAIEIAQYAPINSRRRLESRDAATSSSDSESSLSDSSSSDDEDADPGTTFGPHGELLDGQGNAAVVEPEPQPAHINAPFLSADDDIKAVHNDLIGHKGVFITLQRLLRNGRSWGSRKQMLTDVDDFIRGCPVCQKMKKRRDRVKINRHVISGSPFAEISVDVLKLPTPDVRGFRYCIVIIDNFSHWTSVTACMNKSAFDAARAILQFIGNFGAPLRIRSDGGKEFVNGVITGLSRMMGVSSVVVQPYTPSANGIVERANRAILERVREMCMCERLIKHTSSQWSDLLPLVQRTLNASFHSAIGTSPSRILFGDSIDLDRAILTKIPDGKAFDVDNYCDVLAHNQRVIIEESDRIQTSLCDKVIAKAAAKQRQRPAPAFAVNDWVLVKPQPKYPIHKLAPRWPGPFRIHQIDSDKEKVMLVDTVANKVFSALKRQLEPFDISRVSDVSGLTKVAEMDAFEFPVESIIGHALLTEQGVGINPVQLNQNFSRGVRPKNSFQFLIKWTGYEEPSWIAYKDAKKLVQFPGYVSVFPSLNLL